MQPRAQRRILERPRDIYFVCVDFHKLYVRTAVFVAHCKSAANVGF